MILKVFKETESDRIFLNSFMEDNITLIPKPHKVPTRKERYRPVLLININVKIIKLLVIRK